MTEAAEWSGPVGDVWAREWRRTDRSAAAMTPHLDAAILARAPPRAFRAVDLGCGAGSTSLALTAARPDARVTGVDLSAGLVAVARERAASRDNLDFVVGDAVAEVGTFAPIDLFVSRHGVMFYPDPREAFATLRHAAAPGAGLVFSCFRAVAHNEWVRALLEATGGAPPWLDGYEPGPFAFADPDFVSHILAAEGWRDVSHRAVDFRYRVGEGADPVADALEFLRRIGPAARMLRAADPEDVPAILERLRALLESRRTANVIDFPAAAWIWSATA